MDVTEIPVVRLKMIKDYSLKITDKEIYGVSEAAPIFDNLIGGSTLEKMAILCIDSSNKSINAAVLNIGSHKDVKIVPSEIFRIAILSNASSIFICHNHPSGIVKPSDYDIEVTKRIGQIGNLLGIKLIDSLILGDFGECLSMRTELKKAGESDD
ncbi:JAB domain-containing protein [Clostridium sp. UBA5988]|uniref:JAB domain-containing protein n=1 Tax=Clostridium sp. UBA5988 TaxID=1946369 RepID=UPI00321756D8